MVQTVTVGAIQRVLAGLPADQPVLLIGEDGLAYPIKDIHPLTVTDQDGVAYLTIELETEEDGEYFGFEPSDDTKICTN